MVDRSVTMRVMAEKYEWLAKTAANPAERQRFSDYAKLYREMELHFVEVEKRAGRREPRSDGAQISRAGRWQ
jgi:hypothetical protein